MMLRSRRSVLGRLAVLPLAGLVGACSKADVVNALVTRDGYDIVEDIAYGPLGRQRLDIYRPLNATVSTPVVVFFYGGGWDSGDRRDYLFVGQRLAAAGYVVVIPDYRLYPDVVFPGFIEDCALAVAWVGNNIADHGGDPDRMALTGHSAGAYNTMMLALDRHYLDAVAWPTERVAAVVGLAGPYDFRPFDSALLRGVFGSYPDAGASQPISFARSDAPPLLLATGLDDITVLPANSERLAARVAQTGGRVELVTYQGVGHVGIVASLADPLPETAPVAGDMTDFLERYL
ncbi:MAG: alpha/beta hydrolase [Alphaproteobacteria bacterium]|jgi:acetyl esterase/lipase